MNTPSHRASFSVKSALSYALVLLGAWTLAVYLQLEPVPLFRLLLTGTTFFSLHTLMRSPLKKRETAVFALFSAASSSSGNE